MRPDRRRRPGRRLGHRRLGEPAARRTRRSSAGRRRRATGARASGQESGPVTCWDNSSRARRRALPGADRAVRAWPPSSPDWTATLHHQSSSPGRGQGRGLRVRCTTASSCAFTRWDEGFDKHGVLRRGEPGAPASLGRSARRARRAASGSRSTSDPEETAALPVVGGLRPGCRSRSASRARPRRTAASGVRARARPAQPGRAGPRADAQKSNRRRAAGLDRGQRHRRDRRDPVDVPRRLAGRRGAELRGQRGAVTRRPGTASRRRPRPRPAARPWPGRSPPRRCP